MSKINWPLVGAVFVMTALIIFLYSVKISVAQEHHHPPQDQEIHERFYSTWMMPDAPHVSCCHNEDCKPTSSRFIDGHWEARWSEDMDWVSIPASKVEQNRDTPDGRSHMCGRQYGTNDFSVFCFIAGAGG
jgi:hypothetical protein